MHLSLSGSIISTARNWSEVTWLEFHHFLLYRFSVHRYTVLTVSHKNSQFLQFLSGPSWHQVPDIDPFPMMHMVIFLIAWRKMIIEESKSMCRNILWKIGFPPESNWLRTVHLLFPRFWANHHKLNFMLTFPKQQILLTFYLFSFH